jgi:hypothetical protein
MTRARSVSLSLVASFLVASAIGALVGLSGVASGGSRQPNVRMAITHHPGGTAHRIEQQSVSGESGSSSPVPAPTPTVQSVPSTEQLQYVGPPYISESDADSAAMQVATRWDPEHRC